jgi:hypothetical protein
LYCGLCIGSSNAHTTYQLGFFGSWKILFNATNDQKLANYHKKNV